MLFCGPWLSLSTQITGKSPFIAETDGALLLSIEGRPLQPADVQNVLLSFGELMSFGDVPSDSHDQVSLRALPRRH